MTKKKPRKPNATYDLPAGMHCSAEKLILGMDPGSRNFGISLVGSKGDKVKIYANSVLTLPVSDLVNFNAASTEFLKEIARWVSLEIPNGFVMERFQTRGSAAGPLIEYVGTMIGILRGRYPKIPMKLTIASTWKNKFNRRWGVDLKEIYPTTLVQPHQLDATLLAIFGLEVGTGKELNYSIENVIKQTEATSLIGLRRVKGMKK